jgi:hypothetical protein
MICPSCSKHIPTESRFCLFCGTRLPTAEPLPVKQVTPSIGLEVVAFGTCGQTVVERGYLNERLRRGFEFSISVRDSNRKTIQSDGELIVALKGPYPNASGSPHLLGPSLKTARNIGASSDVLWHRSFALKVGDFASQPAHTSAPAPDGQEPSRVYSYREIAPILSVDADYCVELHAWFILSNGQCLYQAASALWSR